MKKVLEIYCETSQILVPNSETFLAEYAPKTYGNTAFGSALVAAKGFVLISKVSSHDVKFTDTNKKLSKKNIIFKFFMIYLLKS